MSRPDSIRKKTFRAKIRRKREIRKQYSQDLSRLEKGLSELMSRIRSGAIRNLATLSFMLQLNGKPMSMEKFSMFKPMLDLPPPYKEIWKTARQVAKTTTGAAQNELERVVRPGTKSLIVTPYFQQIKRISQEVISPLTEGEWFGKHMAQPSARQTILCRRYYEGSITHMSYAVYDASRIRSLSGMDRCWFDEFQDIQPLVIPVVEQTMSAKPYTHWSRYTGTPLSNANHIETNWKRSSQAEQAFPCSHCGKVSIACTEQHLLKMVKGKHGPVCAHCDRDIDVFNFFWEHQNPAMAEEFPGYHISQVVHPLHALIQAQWNRLLANVEGAYADFQLYNEVFGESFDSAERMISLKDMAGAAVLPANSLRSALGARNEYAVAAMGVDWGGGGGTVSRTKVILGGIKPDSNRVEVRYMEALPSTMPLQAQIHHIAGLVNQYKPDIFAHDFTGAGWVFEGMTLNVDNIVSHDILWPFTYVTSPKRSVIYIPEEMSELRQSLHIDQTRSLFALFTQIKAGHVLFPSDIVEVSAKDSEAGMQIRPVDDFLSMVSERRVLPGRSDALYVKPTPGQSDDYVHATNFMASACWYYLQSYPATPTHTFGNVPIPIETESSVMDMDPTWMGRVPNWGPSTAG